MKWVRREMKGGPCCFQKSKLTKATIYQGHNADAIFGLLFLITPARLDFAYHVAGVVSRVQEHQ
jgi:hypothetical protein